MDLFPRAFPLNEDGKLKRLVLLRLIMSTLIIGAAIMVKHLYASADVTAQLYLLLGIYYLSNGAVSLASSRGVSTPLLVRLMASFDIAVISTLVHLTGGAGSYFTILFILPIITSGMHFQITGGITTAVLVTSIYITYGFLEIRGYIQSSPEGFGPATGTVMLAGQVLRGYLHMVVFVLTGLISGYISKHILHHGEQLADKEKEIRRIQLDTDSILMNMSSGLVVVDMNGNVLTLNHAAKSILGLRTDSPFKNRPMDIVLDRMPGLVTELEFVLESGKARNRHEVDLENVEGKILPLGISISPLKDETSGVRGVIAVFQDLTEVNEMRDKVRQSDKMAAIGELSAAIAHEVRAPLASICGSIEMLKGEFELSGDNEKLMDLIISESDRLDRIISDFLEYARLRKPAFTPTDIDKCMSEIVMLLRHMPGLSYQSEITLDNRIDDSRIYADDEQIRQVFLNIGLNACGVIKKGGNLTIEIDRTMTRFSETGENEQCVSIDFINDGPAIPDDVIGHIFEPFFTTRDGGTGLGLAIAARIVESHGGLIKVHSNDERTVFSVILPVYAIQTESEPEEDNDKRLNLQGV